MSRVCIDEWSKKRKKQKREDKNKKINLKSLGGSQGSFNLAWKLRTVLTASNSLESDREEKILSWIFSLLDFLS